MTPIGDNLSACTSLQLTIISGAENGDRLPNRVPRRDLPEPCPAVCSERDDRTAAAVRAHPSFSRQTLPRLILPISSQNKAVGHHARSAVACLVCFSSIALTACGGGTRFPSAVDSADASPSISGTGTGTGANDAPVISGKPLPTAVVNVPYVFRPDVHDPDGDVLV
ncbi:MAG: hypothetical protein WCF43_02635, partial [Steroidobacteraceae bacterium]